MRPYFYGINLRLAGDRLASKAFSGQRFKANLTIPRLGGRVTPRWTGATKLKISVETQSALV